MKFYKFIDQIPEDGYEFEKGDVIFIRTGSLGDYNWSQYKIASDGTYYPVTGLSKQDRLILSNKVDKIENYSLVSDDLIEKLEDLNNQAELDEKISQAMIGVLGSISPSDAAPTIDGVYKAKVSGTYNNLNGLVAKVGYETFFIKIGSDWSLFSEVDAKGNDGENGKTIEKFSPTKIYPLNSQVFFNYDIWENVSVTSAGESPLTHPAKWGGEPVFKGVSESVEYVLSEQLNNTKIERDIVVLDSSLIVQGNINTANGADFASSHAQHNKAVRFGSRLIGYKVDVSVTDCNYIVYWYNDLGNFLNHTGWQNAGSRNHENTSASYFRIAFRKNSNFDDFLVSDFLLLTTSCTRYFNVPDLLKVETATSVWENSETGYGRGRKVYYPNLQGYVYTSLENGNTENPSNSKKWAIDIDQNFVLINNFVGSGANATNWGIHNVTGTATHRFTNHIPVKKGNVVTGVIHGTATTRVAVFYNSGGEIVQTLAGTGSLASMSETVVEKDGYAIFYTATVSGSYVIISNIINNEYGITHYDFNRLGKYNPTGNLQANATEHRTTNVINVKIGDLVQFGVNSRLLNDATKISILTKTTNTGAVDEWLITTDEVGFNKFYEQLWIADFDGQIAITSCGQHAVSDGTYREPYCLVISRKNVVSLPFPSTYGFSEMGYPITALTDFVGTSYVKVKKGSYVYVDVWARQYTTPAAGFRRIPLVAFFDGNKTLVKNIAFDSEMWGENLKGLYIAQQDGFVVVQSNIATNPNYHCEIFNPDFEDVKTVFTPINPSYLPVSNYLIDTYEYYNPDPLILNPDWTPQEAGYIIPNKVFDRFDHATIHPFFGNLITITQRFDTTGGDYGKSRIVAHISRDQGVTWDLFSVKGLGSDFANANPWCCLNRDGSIQVFYVHQVNSNPNVRPLRMCTLTQSGEWINDQATFTPLGACALGGTGYIKDREFIYFCWYEQIVPSSGGQDLGQWVAKIFKYDSKNKTFSVYSEIPILTNIILEPGIYIAKDGAWIMHYRTTDSHVWARKSTDEGLTFGEDFPLLKAPHSLTTIKRLNARDINHNHFLWVAVHNVLEEERVVSGINYLRDRQGMMISVSDDGYNFRYSFAIYAYDNAHPVFEPNFEEIGNQLYIVYSTMSNQDNSGRPRSKGGKVLNCIVDVRDIKQAILDKVKVK